MDTFLLYATVLAVLLPPSIAVTRLLWGIGTTQRPQRSSVDALEEAAAAMPEFVTALVEAESEEWARADLRSEALHLHDILGGDWERVQQELHRRHAAPDPEAAEKAWMRSAESLAEAIE